MWEDGVNDRDCVSMWASRPPLMQRRRGNLSQNCHETGAGVNVVTNSIIIQIHAVSHTFIRLGSKGVVHPYYSTKQKAVQSEDSVYIYHAPHSASSVSCSSLIISSGITLI